MTTGPTQYPGLISVPRVTTLCASLVVALCSGTNYAYSAYAPQLGARLQVTHTQLNIVGLAGNLGVYSTGPIWGRIVDTRGPRILLIFAFMLLLLGYSGVRHIFKIGIPSSADTISISTFGVLVICGYMTGMGGNSGLAAAVNSTAKTFPDKMRATATGIVISGFGLSAFLFSTISRLFFAGNTSSFLLVLAVGTASPMILGYFLVRPIPLPPADSAFGLEDGRESSLDTLPAESRGLLSAQEDAVDEGLDSNDIAPSRQLSKGTINGTSLPNVYGWELLASSDFWLLFTILSLLAGTGLTYINNVGSMSQALYAKVNPTYDPISAARWQTDQVSAISLMNFFGRIFIGLVSDFFKNKHGLPRSYSLTLVSFLFFISQIAAANVDNVQHLWIASALLGLAHGSVFSLFPNVCIEWFGMPHFSENWGYLSVSPIVASNIFSVMFGRNLDGHEGGREISIRVRALTIASQCLEGKGCYVDTLYLMAGGCFVALLLSVWAGWRDQKKIANALKG